MLVSNFFIKRILNRIRLLNQYDEDDIDMIRYSLEAILWEIEKTLILLAAFALMGYLDYFLITCLVGIPIRMIAGGYHNQTAIGCLIITFTGFFAAIIMMPRLPVSIGLICVMAFFSLMVTLVAAPIYPLERASLINKENDGKKKVLALVVTALWLSLIFIYPNHPYAYPALGIIVLQNVQLLVEYLKRRWKRND